MSVVTRWVRRPQSLWLRKALFQMHLWTGIGIGLYVLAISISGSAIVFRNELYKSLWPGPKIVAVTGPRLGPEQLRDAARAAYPGYKISWVWEMKKPDQTTEIWLTRNNTQIRRQFDPYTGKDLGRVTPISISVLAWIADFHTDLAGGMTGRKINGIGASFLVVLCITGFVIWWPGVETWRRSLTIDWRAPWKRLNWDLHSAIGFWTLAIIFMWGFTGTYLVFPTPFQKAVNYFAPLEVYRPISLQEPDTDIVAPLPQNPPGSWARRIYGRSRLNFGDKTIRWFTLIHFGTFGGLWVKSLWVLIGLLPSFLFVTGTIMWWNRVLSPFLNRKPADLPKAERATVPATSPGA